MRAENQTERWLIFGAAGFGKTRFAEGLYRRRCQPGRGRGVVVDRKGDLAHLGRVVSSVEEVRRTMAAAKDGPFSLVLRPGWGEDIGGLWRVVYEAGNLLLFVDEVQTWAGKRGADGDLEELIRLSRFGGVDFIATSHRPTDLQVIYRSLYTRLVTFAQPELQDAVRMASDYFERPELARVIQTLPHRHFITRTVGGPVTKGRSPDV